MYTFLSKKVWVKDEMNEDDPISGQILIPFKEW
jgi:hypothetical protein